MSMPSGMELLIIVLVVLILFGGKKIPELAKGIGSGIKNFKNALKEEDEEVSIAKSEKDKIIQIVKLKYQAKKLVNTF